MDSERLKKVKELLIKEYGYLLPEIENCSGVRSINIDPLTIKCHQHIVERLLLEDLTSYKGIEIPIIILEGRLIDGYHRLAFAILNKKPEIAALELIK